MYLNIQDLAVSYEQIGKKNEWITVVDGFSLTLKKGEIGCFLGYSGCGKTTALRAIAGLEEAERGQVTLDGILMTDANAVQSHLLPPAQRDMGMVFQDYALFGHLTVADNIAFGLHKWDKASKQTRVNEMLELIELSEHSDKKPAQLSGGQQQRVALARALAPKPKLLLLDEPFSNLDVVLRESLAMNVREILKRTETTAILVTHDQNEAFALADKIGVMNKGKLVQWATPTELYHQPATPFVADFIGEGAMIHGQVKQGNIHTPLGMLKVPNTMTELAENSRINLLIRPDDIVHDDDSSMTVKVISRVFRGANYLYQLELSDGQRVLSLVPSHHDHEVGSNIGIYPDLEHLVVFTDNSC